MCVCVFAYTFVYAKFLSLSLKLMYCNNIDNGMNMLPECNVK